MEIDVVITGGPPISAFKPTQHGKKLSHLLVTMTLYLTFTCPLHFCLAT